MVESPYLLRIPTANARSDTSWPRCCQILIVTNALCRMSSPDHAPNMTSGKTSSRSVSVGINPRDAQPVKTTVTRGWRSKPDGRVRWGEGKEASDLNRKSRKSRKSSASLDVAWCHPHDLVRARRARSPSGCASHRGRQRGVGKQPTDAPGPVHRGNVYDAPGSRKAPPARGGEFQDQIQIRLAFSFSPQTGANIGTGGPPSLGTNLTFTLCPIFSAAKSQSTRLVIIEGPSSSVTYPIAYGVSARVITLNV